MADFCEAAREALTACEAELGSLFAGPKVLLGAGAEGCAFLLKRWGSPRVIKMTSSTDEARASAWLARERRHPALPIVYRVAQLKLCAKPGPPLDSRSDRYGSARYFHGKLRPGGRWHWYAILRESLENYRPQDWGDPARYRRWGSRPTFSEVMHVIKRVGREAAEGEWATAVDLMTRVKEALPDLLVADRQAIKQLLDLIRWGLGQRPVVLFLDLHEENIGVRPDGHIVVRDLGFVSTPSTRRVIQLAGL